MSNTTHANDDTQTIIARIRSEIMPLFEQLAAGERAFYDNPHLERCWDESQPPPSMCPTSTAKHVRCWQIVSDQRRENAADNVCFPIDCKQCPVYQGATPGIVEELGEAFNLMVYLLGKQEETVRNAVNFTRDLAVSLEDLDLENRLIREKMNTDPLTGLFNRRHLDECLLNEVARCQNRRRTLSVVMMDIDHFKSYNDMHGHLEGDRMLARFGKLLKRSVRDYDKVFRYGGEEFVIIFPDTGQDAAMKVAERIRENFAEMVFNVPVRDHSPEGKDSRSVSGGVAAYLEGMGAVELLEQADQAMYAAKQSGRNRIVKNGVHVVV